MCYDIDDIGFIFQRVIMAYDDSTGDTKQAIYFASQERRVET